MKKTSEELDRIQQDAVVRRQLIESGRIRIIVPKKATSQSPQKEEVAGKLQHVPA